jgi:hypothetical protein
VWEDYLLPLLTRKEVARLGCTCKALRGVVREHFKGDIGRVNVWELQAALTTFPRARSVALSHASGPSKGLNAAEMGALVEWLRSGGHGGAITTVTTAHERWDRGRDVHNDHARLIHAALQSGALPSLKGVVAVNLGIETQRASLTGGLLQGMHELRLKISSSWSGPQLAALGLVRQLPALATLELQAHTLLLPNPDAVEWPPFIPPSLRSLRVVHFCRELWPHLPGMLGASGAGLERLEVEIPSSIGYLGDDVVHVTHALHACAPTLTRFFLEMDDTRCAYEYEVLERFRVQWAELLAGVSACRELQVLVLPDIEFEPLFPPGTAFAHLTKLKMTDHEREHPPDDAGGVGLWELMASGGLPALAQLSVRLEGRWGGVEEVRTRVAPAFEAVAGTLTRLKLEKESTWPSDEVEVGYEVGVAAGKLRRLKELAVNLTKYGRAYHAFARGLAASGGDCPLPLLWRVSVPTGVETSADLLASLLLPGVRVFATPYLDPPASFMLACALRQRGYKHAWVVSSRDKDVHMLRAVSGCRLDDERRINESWDDHIRSLSSNADTW